MIRLLSKNLPIIVVLVGLTGCGGGVLGIGDETSLYRVGNNADTAPAVAQGRIPLYIARPQMPSGADADRIPLSKCRRSHIWPRPGGPALPLR